MVDFSCGANLFIPKLKARCRAVGLPVTAAAYDIILSRDNTDFHLASWFEQRKETGGAEEGGRAGAVPCTAEGAWEEALLAAAPALVFPLTMPSNSLPRPRAPAPLQRGWPPLTGW